MECDQCGARRPRSGPCPECGAPAPGTYSSMRQWRDQTRTGQGPAVGGGRGSGANWKNSASSSRMRNPRNGWDEGGYEEEPPARSSAANRRRPNYEEVDLEQALVPSHGDMLPMDPNAMSMGAGLPALPGIPQTDEEERAIGIRRPVYIPATSEKRKKKLGTWRVLSGVVSVMLICVASCGVAALFGRSQLAQLLSPASRIVATPQAYSTAGVPVTPVATPGPQHTYVTNIVTAQGVSTDYNAVNQTSHFKAGQQVDVLCLVRGIAKGQKHTILIHWFYDGTDMGLPIVNGKTSEEITSDQVVYFTMQYPTVGLGMAKIFFDLPSTDNGDQANDPYLAGQILFAIDPANGASGTPTQVPTATPKATPKATATATAKTT
jgi:hypothetical protein